MPAKGSPADQPIDSLEKPRRFGAALRWVFTVFLAGLILIFGLRVGFNILYERLEGQSANERARLFIGEEVVRGIHSIEKGLYQMAATPHGVTVGRIHQSIDRELEKLHHDLEVLKNGGSVKREIQLNVEGHDLMVSEVHYRQDARDQAYILELIEILPLIEQVDRKINELNSLLVKRWAYREEGNLKKFFAIEQEIALFLKHIPPYFSRLDENANRLFYESTEHLRSLETELEQQRTYYKTVEMVLIGTVIVLAALAVVLVMRRIDDTHRRLAVALREMRVAKEEAERASRAKSEFVSRMSHELRTPLNAILGFAQLLEAEPLTASLRNYVELINRSGRHLMDLINQVLDHAKIEAGRITLENIAFDLRQAGNEVATIIAEQAGAKGIGFVATFDPNLPRYIFGDPTRLRQVLINLLINAVKFTEQGTVELAVTSDEEHIYFSIRDTGIGMDAQALDQLFKPFGQADISITRKYGGTGLGLLISKELVHAMGGSIEVKSRQGTGSCFRFSLPARVASSPAPIETSNDPAIWQSDLHQLVDGRILLVDDNRINRTLAAALLERLGLEHDMANDGLDCLRQLANTSYALILMDMEMPEMDGLTATRHIREQERASGRSNHLPIIAMTANAMNEDRQQCFDAGMDGYVAKPINLAALEKEIRRTLRSRANEVATTVIPADHGLSYDHTEAVAALGDEQLFAEIATMFIADAKRYQTEIGEALATRNWPQLIRSAHTVKGLAATFIARQTETVARQLEMVAGTHDFAASEALASRLNEELDLLVGQLSRSRPAHTGPGDH